MGNMNKKVRRVYDKTHWFSDTDAWMLFRLAAFAEALTWAMLISSILARNAGWVGGEIAVSMAGTVHGVMLLVYLTFVGMLARSMEWGLGRIFMGVVVGNIPFATIVFERLLRAYRTKHPVAVAAPRGYMQD